MKIYKTLVIVLLLAVIILAFFQISLNRKLNQSIQEQEEIHSFLANQYGPCFGIKNGQCRE